MEKDQTELDLEGLVFGNDTGFHDDLKRAGQSVAAPFVDRPSRGFLSATDNVEEEDVENLHDADVCKIRRIERTIS